MSTETVTQTFQELKLTPPDPVPTVAPQQAMGLVPVTDEQQSKLAQRVEAYVEQYTAGEGFDIVYDTVGGATLDAMRQRLERIHALEDANKEQSL